MYRVAGGTGSEVPRSLGGFLLGDVALPFSGRPAPVPHRGRHRSRHRSRPEKGRAGLSQERDEGGMLALGNV